MDLFVSVVASTANALIVILEIAMFLRAILSWLPIREDHPIVLLLCMVTEPVITPFRVLFDHFGWFQDVPIDIPFFAGYLALTAISTMLALVA